MIYRLEDRLPNPDGYDYVRDQEQAEYEHQYMMQNRYVYGTNYWLYDEDDEE